MKVIGAGYGRTGTKSLQIALEKIGYESCYHMEKLLTNPGDVVHWKKAYKEEKVNWDELFADYNSIVDFPGAMFYKELANYYPEAKIILTVRDPQSWYESVKNTIYSFDPGVKFKLRLVSKMPFSSDARNLLKVIQLNDKSIWDKYFEGKFENKEYAINKFKNHIDDVKRAIPKERLLIFESKDGWEPLCKFLGKEVPNSPYPRSNQKENFHQWALGLVEQVV